MPTYDYRCAACGHKLEIFHGMSEKPRKTCPSCKKPKLERQISAGAGVLFKGSGFYQTDYRSKSYSEGAKAEKPPASEEPAASEKPAPSEKPASPKKPAKPEKG